ncbi:MAG: ATP-binding protein [Patescibacteria group bacterium]|nr:ATP-binding protein [Patescibacteria group bacterium]
MKFINRENELTVLNSNIMSGGLFIIYGRRRIGKTELLKQLKVPKKFRKIYYLVKEQPIEKTLEELNNKFIKELDELSLLDSPINNINKLFNFLMDKKIIFILDEFPLLMKEKNILGYMQEFLDNKPESAIILCGSYISAMEKIKDYSSPIYGRRMLSLKVQPLNFKNIKKFSIKSSKEELIKIYGVLGGIPEYLLKYSGNFDNFIKTNLFKKDSYLYEEAEFLLRYELRDLSLYNSILKSIASGCTTLNEIAQKSYVKKNAIVKYINMLIGLDIVKKELPYLSAKKEKLKERGALYFIKDNYFNFYYNFIYPFKEEIDLGYTNKVFNFFNKNYNAYLGYIFEEAAKQLIIKKYKANFGRQWGNYKSKKNKRLETLTYEIDLLSVDQKTKNIIAFEVKWKNLSYQKTKNILNELKNKIKYLPLELDGYKIKIGIVGKNIKNKNKIKNNNFLAFDLRDF